MKKNLLIGFAVLVFFSTILFSGSEVSASILPLQENNFALKGSVIAVFVLESKNVVLPPVEEEGSIFTNPFYVVSAFLILMLVVEIVLFKRKREREKKNKGLGKDKYISGADSGDLGKKSKTKRYSKEEMSAILKASASKGKVQVVNTATGVKDENQVVRMQPANEQEQPKIAPLVFELKEPDVIEQLPQNVEDDTYYDAMADCEDTEPMIRIVAVRILSKHKTSNSVKLLSRAAMEDVDAEVRLEAVDGLRAIGHESVFAPLLVAVSDDSPNVKQAAIKALSSLSFNMTDSYVRLINADDEDLLKKVAKASLVTGLVHKAFMQLSSQNQHEANEGFALLSLLARAGETKPLLDAITKHPNMDIRILAIKIMNDAHRPEGNEQLIGISERQDLPSVVRTSLIQAIRRNAPVM